MPVSVINSTFIYSYSRFVINAVPRIGLPNISYATTSKIEKIKALKINLMHLHLYLWLRLLHEYQRKGCICLQVFWIFPHFFFLSVSLMFNFYLYHKVLSSNKHGNHLGTCTIMHLSFNFAGETWSYILWDFVVPVQDIQG